MSAETKKWINRSGIGAVGVGIVLILVAGGDTEVAITLAGKVAVIGGLIIGLIREAFN
jgi:hypothetical protein